MAKARRLKLSEALHALGVPNVYFQPPESKKLSYPCLIYNLSSGDNKYADNSSYIFRTKYDLLYISRDPDDEMVDKIIETFEYCRHGRHYVSDNLIHDAFVIFW